jgi:hypothetical protein
METEIEKTQMNTLAECMAELLKRGFKENFVINEAGLLSADGKNYSPTEVKIVNFYRFEGESDPADSAILYAIETCDRRKGMIMNAYGQYSDSKVNAFIGEVDKITKQAHQ